LGKNLQDLIFSFTGFGRHGSSLQYAIALIQIEVIAQLRRLSTR
jgi:hypothetical protein